MAGKEPFGLLKTGIEVRQPFHDRRPRHDDKARIRARAKHERLALADDARHVGLRSLRDSDWLTKCANMVNGWLMLFLPCDGGTGARSHSRAACAPEACRPKPRILSPQRNEGRRSAGRRDCLVGPRHAADV